MAFEDRVVLSTFWLTSENKREIKTYYALPEIPGSWSNLFNIEKLILKYSAKNRTT
jgi:hypothetical protein